MTEVLKPLFEQSNKDVSLRTAKNDLFVFLLLYGKRIHASVRPTNQANNELYRVPANKMFFLYYWSLTTWKSDSNNSTAQLFIGDDSSTNSLSYLNIGAQTSGDLSNVQENCSLAEPLAMRTGEILNVKRQTAAVTVAGIIIGYEIDYQQLLDFYKN